LLKACDSQGEATWAIVALKSPAEAKSRLRPYCSDDERRSLYFLMARKALLALKAVPAIDKVLAVTASDEVASFVKDLGGHVIRQPEDLGTRAAFAHALDSVMGGESPPPSRVLMISGDLPLITPAAVDELLDRCRTQPGVAIIPDQRRQGTNGLVCSPPDAVEPCFGEDSLRRHCSAARARGHQVQMIESRALSLDIDDHDDLLLLSELLAPGAASDLDPGLAAWLHRHFSAVASRVGVIENADCA
jgi:2-phospho-L-lactate/phosphoenolpyruvate guanylyltransferase